MIVSRVINPEVARDMLRRMGSVITDDGTTIDTAEIDTVAICWLMVYADGQQIALYKLLPVNSVALEIHVNVAPEYRKALRHESCRAVYRWILEHTPCQKLIAWVPALHPHIKRFATEMGMSVEGESTNSYQKNGQLWNQWLLGISRPQMEEFV